MRNIFLTGERPTGNLHIGHLFGTIKKRIKIQRKNKIFIIIADNQLNKNEKKKKKKNIIKLMMDYFSTGINIKKNCIFLQSKIKELLELSCFLSNFINVNTLKRNPIIKNNISDRNISCNEFFYPISQSSDILLFNANLIPVGKDQLPMLEITNKIVRNINIFFKKEIFRKCKALLSKNKKIIGIDGTKKMSKTQNNTIPINCKKEKLIKIIRKLKTDHKKKTIYSPGNYKNSVVFNYLKLFSKNEEYRLYKKDYKKGKLSDIKTKEILFLKIWRKIKIFRKRRKEIKKKQVKKILKINNKKARSISKKRISLIKKNTSFFF
ncbi:Tryptophan--tRNA ligase (Trp-tRNA) [Candidatus Vidania fulgoroideae]|nr:Tryptophan--tRNA ligase (Trp-tRNA) [Candidatus Vidania fulgoroideae]